jgi:hypothetical protein
LEYVYNVSKETKEYYSNKKKNKKYHTVGVIPKYNIKIVKRGKINTPNTQIHDPGLHLPGLVQALK